MSSVLNKVTQILDASIKPKSPFDSFMAEKVLTETILPDKPYLDKF